MKSSVIVRVIVVEYRIDWVVIFGGLYIYICGILNKCNIIELIYRYEKL